MMCNKNIKEALKITLPVIFIAYFCSITFFTHSHDINGVTIVHSHPFKADANGNPNHEHTGNELQLIDALSTFYVENAIILAVLLHLFCQWKQNSFIEDVSQIALRKVKSPDRLRSPPAF